MVGGLGWGQCGGGGGVMGEGANTYGLNFIRIRGISIFRGLQ